MEKREMGRGFSGLQDIAYLLIKQSVIQGLGQEGVKAQGEAMIPL